MFDDMHKGSGCLKCPVDEFECDAQYRMEFDLEVIGNIHDKAELLKETEMLSAD